MSRGSVAHYSLLSVLLSIAAGIAAGVTTTATTPKSPSQDDLSSSCPDVFSYDAGGGTGRRTGNLHVRSEFDLHGLWIRLIFNNQVQDVQAEGFEVVKDEDARQVLIKNRNYMYKGNSEKVIKLDIKYNGNEAPKLIEYRLNAKRVCPEDNINRDDYFRGDTNSKNFLAIVTKISQQQPSQKQFACGSKPQKGQLYPWAVSVFIKRNNKEEYVCEANLISPKHVLTAAHCITFQNGNTKIPKNMIALRIGKQSGFLVTRIVTHPEYEGSLLNDIAILELSSAIAIDDKLSPICLPNDAISDNGFIVGPSEAGQPQTESKARRISQKNCVKRSPNFLDILSGDDYCISYAAGTSKCIGNSGSGFVTISNNTAILKGIVLLGSNLQNKYECREDDLLVVADLSRHIRWISKQSLLH